MNRKETLKKVLTYIKPYGIYVAASVVLAVVTVFCTLYIPLLTGDVIDCMLGAGKVDFKEIFSLLRIMAVVILCSALAQWFLNIVNNKITFQVIRDIRRDAFLHLELLPLKYLDKKTGGDIVSRVISDVDQFADGLLMGFTQLFTGVITIAGTLGLMLSVSLPVALVVVVLTPVSLFVARFIAAHTYDMFSKQSEIRGEQTSLIDEMIGNQKVVQAFGYEKEAQKRFDEINIRLKDCSMKAIFYSSITNPGTRFVNSLVYAGVGITGAILAIRGGITVGRLSCFLSYANQYTKPFNEISGVITELQNAIACASRIFELIEEKLQSPDPENPVVVENFSGAVEISHVDFSYVKEKELIKDFCLKVEPGQSVAIVGPTGCGKTTLINLLMRFYETDSGKISVSNVDIREMTRHNLRRGYGMVLQETWLKTGTVLENIMMGKSDAAREEVVEAAKCAHADSFIRRLPKGYDTELTEDGGSLSQGQKQLLCIARVMLALPAMLILDEATSSIDTRTELKVQSAFSRMMEGRTSFVVAHRLSTIKEADTILVMKDGNVIEQGNHETLLTKKGFYKKLYESQFEH